MGDCEDVPWRRAISEKQLGMDNERRKVEEGVEMAESSIMTDQIRKAKGKEFGPFVYEVEKGAIKRIAEAVGDPNPLWQDEEHGRRSRYGTIVASPTFLFTLRFDEVTKHIEELECPLKDVLNGGSEIEYFEPIRPGDVITVRAKLADVQERVGKRTMLIFAIDLTYENQKGALLAKHRFNFIRY